VRRPNVVSAQNDRSDEIPCILQFAASPVKAERLEANEPRNVLKYQPRRSYSSNNVKGGRPQPPLIRTPLSFAGA
jgi:hypothetical protein